MQNAGERLIQVFREVCEEDALLEEALRLAGKHLDRAALCDEAVNEHGPLIVGTRGTLVANPMLAESRYSRVAAYAIIRDCMPDEESAGAAIDAASVDQRSKNPAKQRAAFTRWERARVRAEAD